MSFSCKGFHEFLKIGLVSIKMIAVNVIKSSLILKELYTVLQMSHVNINMDFLVFIVFTTPVSISLGIRHILKVEPCLLQDDRCEYHKAMIIFKGVIQISADQPG